MNRLNLLVERDAARTKAPVCVFDVELPILQQLFSNVEVVSSAPYDDEIEVDDLYGRLALKYKAPDAEEAFTAVYPTPRALARAMHDGIEVDAPEADDAEAADKPARGRRKAK